MSLFKKPSVPKRSMGRVGRLGNLTPGNFIRSLLRSIIVIGILSCVIWGMLRFFTVQTILCTEAGKPCDANILTFFSGWKNKYIFQSFEFNVPTKQGTIQKEFPHTLIVTIDTPIVLMHVYTDPGKQMSVSLYSDGTVVKDADISESVGQEVKIEDDALAQMDGKKITTEQLSLYTTLFDAKASLPITSIRIITQNEIEIETNQQLTAIVSATDLTAKLHSLQLILTSPTIEQKPARVDLRFDRPVLRYL